MSLQLNAGAVRRFGKAMKFGAWLQALPNKLTPAPFRLMQIGSAFWQSRALYVAARLDVATVLGDDSLEGSELAARIAVDGDAMVRLMRLLVALGIFEETAPRVFRNNQLSRHLRSDHPRSVRAMILMHNSEIMGRPWAEQLEAGVRSGVSPFRLTHGEELFAYLDHHSDFDKLFSEAMDSVEALAGEAFVRDFNWGGFTRVLDIGGSRGRKSLAILEHHPRLQALVVDRPQTVAEARAYWAAHSAPPSADVLARLDFRAGDLFEVLPAAESAGDIYLLSAVLHGFDDACCLRAMGVLRKAIGQSGARVAVMELVLPERGADIAHAAFDMQMFVGSSGRERTLREWCALIERSGFALEEVVNLQSLGSILVLRAA